MAYDGSVELISGIVQKNNGNFPLVDSSAVRVTDDKRLDVKLAELESQSSSGVDEKIQEAIGALNKSDTAVDTQFITSVSETNGIVSVERKQPSSADISDFASAVMEAIGGSGSNLVFFADYTPPASSNSSSSTQTAPTYGSSEDVTGNPGDDNSNDEEFEDPFSDPSSSNSEPSNDEIISSNSDDNSDPNSSE